MPHVLFLRARRTGRRQLVDSWLERGDNFLSIIVKYKPQPNGYIFTMGCRNDLH